MRKRVRATPTLVFPWERRNPGKPRSLKSRDVWTREAIRLLCECWVKAPSSHSHGRCWMAEKCVKWWRLGPYSLYCCDYVTVRDIKDMLSQNKLVAGNLVFCVACSFAHYTCSHRMQGNAIIKGSLQDFITYNQKDSDVNKCAWSCCTVGN